MAATTKPRSTVVSVFEDRRKADTAVSERYLLSSKRVAASILALGLTLTLAGQASAQATNDPAGATTRTNAETTPRQEDHPDRGWDRGWLGLLGLLGLAGLLRRNDPTYRRTDDGTRRTT